ncbi:MAG: hypothetical protein COV46_04390 [Deltaproteobacteria bacterium CG11_big_fil_rev_8_21_14_0_20_49_13]|nr:MAG: hypothetical protein COV46_04390 [Deltaproteobacteria bacterium CG11_big_fil_rev_8_21_14_0_20_49_13]
MNKLLALVTVLIVVTASASTRAENFSVGAGPTGSIYVVDAAPELQPGIGGHVFFDYRWSPQISTQFTFMVTTQNGQGISNGVDDFLFFGLPSVDIKYYVLSSESHWDPYIMGGVGFYMLSKASKSGNAPAAGFGADAGLGLDYYFTEKWSVGANAQFRSIGLITSTTGNNNGTAIFPFTMNGYAAIHF